MARQPIWGADIVVLTALEFEYCAVRTHLADLSPYTDRHGTRYEIGLLRGGACRIALALIGEGNLAAAALTGHAIEEFGPSALLLVGVAGALGRDAALGDVVVATRTHAYQCGRDDAAGFRPRPKSWPAPHGLEQTAREVARTRAWTAVTPTPTVHFKPVVSGEVILDSRTSALANLIAHYYSDAVAIDTESAGVAEAAHRKDFHRVVVVRAVSDAADGRKHHTDAAGWQHRAAAHAASFAAALAERIHHGPTHAGGASRVVSAQAPALVGAVDAVEVPELEGSAVDAAELVGGVEAAAARPAHDLCGGTTLTTVSK